MKFICICLLSLVSCLTFAFSSPQSTEAIVTFSHWVELPQGTHSMSAAKSAINDQLYYVVGVLNYGRGLGTPQQNFNLENSDIRIEKKAAGIFIAKYSYRGTFVLRKSADAELTLGLPNNPQTIFQVTEARKRTAINPCTDPIFQAEENFWYFWNPKRPGCQDLIKEGVDFSFVKARVRRLESTQKSFPEYSRLPDRKGEIQLSLLFGKNDFNRKRSPEDTSKGPDDLNAKSYRKVEKALLALGFQSRIWSNEEIKSIVPERLNPYPFVKEFTYRYASGPATTLKVQLIFSNSDLNYTTEGLRYFYKYALENSAVVVYDGHSGFGGSLDPEGMGSFISADYRPQIDKDRYQIYFFNSCTSYAFYNWAFFKKKPSSSLDIFTAGLETPFDGGEQADIELIAAIHQWALNGSRLSYQMLLQKMDNGNLLGINGDEDNP